MQERSSKIGTIAFAIAAGVLVVSVGYAALRNSAPAASNASAESSPTTVETLEERVRSNPQDVEALSALGSAHFTGERFADAERAFARAAELAPSRAGLWSALGEARVMASATDPMPAPALAAFRKALELDSTDPRSRYFVAVQRDLSGDHAGAIHDWLMLLADTPAGAPWEADLRRTIDQVGKINKIETASRLAKIAPAPPAAGGPALSGPTPDQIRAAGTLPPREQAAMVEGMVASVEAKLAANPRDVGRWEMLMRSRMTLNQPDKAAAALKSAIAANPAERSRLQATGASLGIPTS